MFAPDGDGGEAVAFGEGAAAVVDDEGEVAVARGRAVEGLEEEDLAGGVGEVVVAADDIGDAAEGVVGGVGEEEGEASVGAADDEVSEVLAVEA